MNIFLDESSCRQKLFPFTQTRHVAAIRVGILTIEEKWQKLGFTVHLQKNNLPAGTIRVQANIIPTQTNHPQILASDLTGAAILEYPWQIFQFNDSALREDFKLLTAGRTSAPLSSTNKLIGAHDIFIEESAEVEHAVLNTSTGPVYIGNNAVVMEGCLIRGPFALCENAVLKMGARIYGATTLGPHCVGGGEIKNSVFFAHSNKAHDGYLGDSVIGEWCNLGAGTSNSNVKNTGGAVNYITGKNSAGIAAGNKAGLLMGDYSRAAINTSFNTGTVAGVCCNIFGNDTPERYIENFSWGRERYIFDKALNDISNWKKMKGRQLTEEEKSILTKLYNEE